MFIQNGIIAQSYGWNAVFSLIDDDYDIIVKTRFDLKYSKEIIFDNIDLNSFNCIGKSLKKQKETQYQKLGITDYLFAGNYDTMKKVMSNYHEYIVDPDSWNDPDCVLRKRVKNKRGATQPLLPEYVLKLMLEDRYKVPIRPIEEGEGVDIVHGKK